MQFFIQLWILKNKMYHGFHKNIVTVFNIANNHKCLLISKSSFHYDFWRSRDTEDWRNDAENTAAHHRNTLQYIYAHRKQLF